MKNKVSKILKVGILMGGPSAEHEVSLLTGQNVIDNLDRSKYEPLTIKVSTKPGNYPPFLFLMSWELEGRLI